jgi:predicted outer membrane repeat protein
LQIYGLLSAIGKMGDSIIFTTKENIPGWNGIEIIRNYIQIDDDSIFFAYCSFKNVHKNADTSNLFNPMGNGSVFYVRNYNHLKINYCRFSANNSEGDGGAIFVEGGGENTEIKYSVFENNSTLGSGGAIALIKTSALIYSNTFKENNALYSGGAIYTQSDNSLIQFNYFNSNKAEENGGAIYIGNNSSASVENNFLQNNKADLSGGAIYAGFHSSPKIIKNIIKKNSAQIYGGAINADDFCYPLVISNNLIYSNNAKSGGAISLFNSQADISVNTIILNTASFASAIFMASEAPVKISSNIIYYNSSPDSMQIRVKEGTSPPFIDFSCIQNGVNGVFLSSEDEDFKDLWVNVIAKNPEFVNMKNGDFKLRKGSPCINAGTTMTSIIDIPEFDLNGEPRIQDDVLDIGAYEYFNEEEF